ncbi:hypothetical protein Celaphus_00017221 [Cervus elaphus hippelaphus]|uniref:Uncharacterized protein n=1 Tax=Cervus elaphus hippelaphus TaxID=46360 RepID=A0A212D6D5_CEREH|nr:hypothetical protein Celaphus_00017221 [Cervus elaphus hippelaphus]
MAAPWAERNGGLGTQAEAKLCPSQVPVAHCFGPRGLYKRRFCSVCRKGLEALGLRCEGLGWEAGRWVRGVTGPLPAYRVCELHVHPDCVPFACSDCRQCHQDGHREHDAHLHHWREGTLPSGARCELCRKTCGSSDVPAGVRCEWCGVQPDGVLGLGHSSSGSRRLPAFGVCSAALAPECTFGRLRTLVLPPACVRLLSRNFSKMHCFRIPEIAVPEPGDGEDSADGSVPAGPGREVGAPESGKQTLKIFDGSDAMQRNHFRTVTVPHLARSQEVLEAALRAYYIPEDPQGFQLQALPTPAQLGDTVAAGKEILKIYPAWLKVGVAYVSIRVTPQSTARSVVLEVLPLLGRQAEGVEGFQLVEVLMDSRQVQRTVLADEEPLLDRLREIRQGVCPEDTKATLARSASPRGPQQVGGVPGALLSVPSLQMSLRQMSQTRFYVAESRALAPRVSLFVGGLPPGLSPQEYRSLLDEAVASKGPVTSSEEFLSLLIWALGLPSACSRAHLWETALVTVSHVYSTQGPGAPPVALVGPGACAVVLDVACFAEAERLYMLVRDTAVRGRPLTALVLPEVLGQVQSGLRSGIRIAQGSYFRVTLLKATPVQVDGEPWVQAPGHLIISAVGPKVHMLRKAKQKPRKAGPPKDARADGAPAPKGDPK